MAGETGKAIRDFKNKDSTMTRQVATMTAIFLIAALITSLTAASWAEEPKPMTTPKPPRPRLTLSREVTFFTEPLAPDGLIDYAAALNARYGKGVTPENNAAVTLLKVIERSDGKDLDAKELADLDLMSAKEFAKLSERLGVDVPPDERDCFVRIDRFVGDVRKQFDRDEAATAKRLNISPEQLRDQLERTDWSDILERCQQAPWSAAEEPLVAAWLVRIARPLELLGEAGRAPRYYVPLDSTDDLGGMLGSFAVFFGPTMSMSTAMQARAMNSLAEGKYDAAWADAVAMRRWGGRACDGKLLIDQLVGITLIGFADITACKIAAHGKFDDARWRELQAEWDSITTGPTLFEALNYGERCFGLEALNLLYRTALDSRWIESLEGVGGPPPTDTKSWRWRRILVGMAVDWDAAFETLNLEYDELAAIARVPPGKQRRAAALRYEDKIERLEAQRANPYQWFSIATLDYRSRRKAVARYFVASRLAATTLPAVAAVIDAETKSQMQGKLTRVTLALARHRATRGEYPDTLDRLVPAFLDKVPVDDFGDGPLVYKRDADCGFVLYSVGPNGKNDGGRSQWPFVDTTGDAEMAGVGGAGDEDADDIVIRVGEVR
ncbi:MAG: hypothetical protein WD875_14050 [Pirellulales bacterium]